MTSGQGPQNPNQAIDVMAPITILHVALMAALVLAAFAVIWWGTVQHRRRKAAERQVERDFAVARDHGATTVPGAESVEGPPTLSADVPRTDTADPPRGAAATPGAGPAATPAASDAAPIATDLTQIKGLGPKLAATLADLGVTRVDQIAALTPSAAADLDAKLGTFRGRMTRDRWIEQARLLSAGDRAGYEAAFGKLGG